LNDPVLLQNKKNMDEVNNQYIDILKKVPPFLQKDNYQTRLKSLKQTP